MLSITKKSKKSFLRYWLNTGGAIAIMFGFSAPAIVGAAGMALDYAQSYLVQQRLSQAIDAAALAGASSSTDAAEIEARVKEFFNINYPPEKFGFTFEPEVTVVGDQVKVKGTAYHDTTFLKVVGIDQIDVEAYTTVNREVRGIEVALVLDVTGSMQGQKIKDLEEATKTFLTTIFNRVSNHNFLKVGMVPYAATVNVGSIGPDIVNEPIVPDRPSVVYDPSKPKSEWAGCVMARETPDDKFDTDQFDGSSWDAYWWEHTVGDTKNNYWDPAQGGTPTIPYVDSKGCNDYANPNLGCPLTNPIIPLTSDYDTLYDAADGLKPWCRGGTLGNLGMAWGWRVLSDTEPFEQGASYNSFLWRKAVVMMTDGENQLWKKPGINKKSDYSAYGYMDDEVMGTDDRGTAKTIANQRFVETCNAMKALGITIHTVVFGTGVIGKPTEDYYKACASSEAHHHRAANGDDLVAVYEDIAKELSNLHISE